MQLCWPDGSKHVEMLLRGITLISGDTVASEAGIFMFQPHDEPIARDFCQNRCGCHRDAVAVGLGLDLNRNRPQSPTEPVMRTIQNGYRRFVAFGYSFANLLGEFSYSASRGECQTLGYAMGIDLFVVGHADGPARNPRGHGLKKLLADFFRDQFGVGQLRGPNGNFAGCCPRVPAGLENGYADRYRPEQGTAANLINADDELGTGIEERLLFI